MLKDEIKNLIRKKTQKKPESTQVNMLKVKIERKKIHETNIYPNKKEKQIQNIIPIKNLILKDEIKKIKKI
jgi:hypothetical protein